MPRQRVFRAELLCGSNSFRLSDGRSQAVGGGCFAGELPTVAAGAANVLQFAGERGAVPGGHLCPAGPASGTGSGGTRCAVGWTASTGPDRNDAVDAAAAGCS